MPETGRRFKRGTDAVVTVPPYAHCPDGLTGLFTAGAGLFGVPPCNGALPVRHRFAILRLARAEVITRGAMTSTAAI